MTSDATPPAIRCSGLRKAYGNARAVDDVSLDVEPGTICALLGPSGCGKTTTLRLIAGLERPDAGSVEVAGRLLSGGRTWVAPERRRIGMVFQDYALFPHLTVAGNVAYALGRRPDESRVADVLDLVGLGALDDRLPHELSGGEQQRVALARALAPTPAVVLLDEPFSNLDATLRNELRAETREILRAADTSALFVTHDQEEALALADTVAVMNAGRIEQVGTPEEVYGRPATRWVATFLGEADVLAGQAREGEVSCALARVSASSELSGPVDVVIRPESIAIGRDPGRSDALDGTVVDRQFYGHDQLVTVDLESGLRIRSRRSGFPAWHPGDRVLVWLDGPVTVLPAPAGNRDAPTPNVPPGPA